MMRPSPCRHNLARLRLFLELGQKEVAEFAGCSVHTIQSVELGRLPLSEELARRISAATHVHLRWLMENDLKAPIVRSPDGRWGYTRAEYENARALNTIGPPDGFMQELSEDYAASFYGQIRAILSSAVKKERGELATWKIAKFLQECRDEFGHDRRLIPHAEQFGLRADDSPYLKVRQVEIGIELFRRYNRERETAMAKTLEQLKKARKPVGTRSRAKKRRRSAVLLQAVIGREV